MKTLRKTIYWIDREWYDVERNEVVGDMGFALEDSFDTRTEDLKGLKNGMIAFAPKEILENNYLDENSDFPIYAIMQAVFECDIEDGEPEEWNDWACVECENTRKVVGKCYYCTKDRARRILKSGCKLDLINPYFAGDHMN